MHSLSRCSRAIHSRTHLSLAKAHAAAAYDYILPPSRIALHPLPNRSSSKLLIVPSQNAPQHKAFTDLPALLPHDAMVVLNASRVIPARLHMRKRNTHGRAELLLLSPAAPSIHAMQSPAHGQTWTAYIGGRRVRVGDVLEKAVTGTDMLSAEVLSRDAQGASVRLAYEGREDTSLTDVLESVGESPLPPYIKRSAEEGDREGYQTVYATSHGSVAAPTAGLHMTDAVLNSIRERGIALEAVVLHVGAGTFAPVDANVIGGHDMHEEVVCVERGSLRNIARHIREERPLVAMVSCSLFHFRVACAGDGC